MPQKPDERTAQDLLHQMLSRTKPALDPEQVPPPPASMLPQPPTVGNPEFLQAVKRLTDKFPETKRSVSQFRQGPTEALMEELVRAKMDINTPQDETSANGIYGTDTKQIGVAGRRTGEGLTSTLAHEASHSQGYGHPDAYFAGHAARDPKLTLEQITELIKKMYGQN